jgi:hypothetical protein
MSSRMSTLRWCVGMFSLRPDGSLYLCRSRIVNILDNHHATATLANRGVSDGGADIPGMKGMNTLPPEG